MEDVEFITVYTLIYTVVYTMGYEIVNQKCIHKRVQSCIQYRIIKIYIIYNIMYNNVHCMRSIERAPSIAW